MAGEKTVLDRQCSFSAGEVSPECYSRTDNPAYKAGLKLARNFLPTKHGAIKNRSGTKFVAACTPNSAGLPPRLIPFSFSDQQTFVLEFNDKYFRVIQNGALVVDGTGNPIVVVTPWAIGDVFRLKYAQSGDVITICHPSYPPQDVSRISNTNWTVGPTPLAPPAWPFGALINQSEPLISVAGGFIPFPVPTYDPAAPYSLLQVVQYVLPDLARNPGQNVTEYFSLTVQPPSIAPDFYFNPLMPAEPAWDAVSWSENQTYGYNQYVWAASGSAVPGGDPASLWISLGDNNTGHIPGSTTDTGWWELAGDADHPYSSVSFAATADLTDSKGVTVESLPTFLTPSYGVFPRFPDRPFTLGFNLAPITGYVIAGFNIYAGNNGVYGLIGAADKNATSYTDLGAAIDFNTPPPKGTNPFLVNLNGIATVSYPGVVSYFQQRRIFGRSNAFPNSFWGSSIGNFLDFDQPDFITDSDSYQFQIASQRLQEIRSIVGQRELFINSVSSDFVASGSNGGVGGAITPTSIDIRECSNHGSSYIDPLPIDRTLVSITSKGNYVRKLTYDWRTANYIGSDISSLVRHLLDGYTIADWFYAEVPDAQIWMVRSDGELISITFDPDFEVVAFAQHDTNAAIAGNAQGQFKAVCSVPEGTEDAVYFVVQRLINGVQQFYIERLSSRFVNGPNGVLDYRQACFLDCAIQYNGRNTSQTSAVALDTVSLAPQIAVSLTNAGLIGGAVRLFVANDAVVNNQVVVHPDGIPQAGTSDLPVAPLPPVRLRIVTVTDGTHAICELDTPAPAIWTPYLGTTDWALATKTFSGLDMINGCAIGALVDGMVDANQPSQIAGQPANVVAGGKISVSNPGVDVIVGLPYFSDMQLLDAAFEQVKTNVKAVQGVSLEVANSRAFMSGENFSNLAPSDPRNIADGYQPAALYTGTVLCPIFGTWNQQGSACVRVSDPTPMTITAAIREIMVGGRG